MLRLPFIRSADLPLAVAAVREAMRQHGVIAIPTETFYGLAVDPHDRQAVEAIFAVKGRDEDKRLSVVGSSLEQLEELVVIGRRQGALLAAAWPAPVTVVLPARRDTAASRGSLAVRVPAHPLLRLLLARTGVLTATSANPSGAPPSADPEEVCAVFESGLHLMLDGGHTAGGSPSTLVDWTGEPPNLVRRGAWTPPSSWGVKAL